MTQYKIEVEAANNGNGHDWYSVYVKRWWWWTKPRSNFFSTLEEAQKFLNKLKNPIVHEE
jgi:hypothetical protein